MIRGTTPTFTFNLPFDASLVSSAYITFNDKNDNTVLEKTLDDCNISGNKISLTLTQEETLDFEERKNIRFQLRGVTASGEAFASQVFTRSAGEVLKEGVI